MSENIFTAQLCKCNKCNTILIDENPAEQPEFDTLKVEFLNMEWVNTADEPGNKVGFWACPNCLTDEYLIDINSPDQLL